jgi:DNA-binding NtrC family response regulator
MSMNDQEPSEELVIESHRDESDEDRGQDRTIKLAPEETGLAGEVGDDLAGPKTSRGTTPAPGDSVPADSSASESYSVVIIEGPDRGREAEVTHSPFVIGSHGECDFVLTDPTVSRRHCEITKDENRFLLRDEGSLNGSELGGTPVREAVLQPGVYLQLGDSTAVFRRQSAASHGVPPSESEWFGELFGGSEAMRSVFGLLERVAPTDLCVVLMGETGTGKELAARALHQRSPRAKDSFIVVDCGALAQGLVESELFGHERGAFTDANHARAGAFEVAQGGTLFLDELGELSPDLQVKLLRVLEQREVKRLGAAEHVHVDVRVLAATNRDLATEVAAGRFRQDLYYRLAEVEVALPPLRERPEDIGPLAQIFVKDQAQRGSTVEKISPSFVSVLESRRWDGNVRELRNVVRQACVMAQHSVLGPEDLPQSAGISPGHEQFDVSRADGLTIKDAREQWAVSAERQYLKRILRKAGGDLRRAATLAGVHRKSLVRLLRKHGIDADDIGD